VAALPAPAPVPRFLGMHDAGDGDWVVLLFEDVDGHHPAQPWVTGELDRVLDGLQAMSDLLTPCPLPVEQVGTASEEFGSNMCGWRRLRDERPSRSDQLDAWSLRYLDTLIELEAAAPVAVRGDTLLHLDVRADNVLLTSERVWFVDWPLASVGAAWVDVAFFAPSVTMQGGPWPEDVMARNVAGQRADPSALTAAVAAIAGFFTHRAVQPPPPGLPTVRAFQAAQGVVARHWTAKRTGWA
jgi:Ser/Thr protein kinase RdoA (MazF antagonist)